MAPDEGQLTDDQRRAAELLKGQGLEITWIICDDGAWMIQGASQDFYQPGATNAW